MNRRVGGLVCGLALVVAAAPAAAQQAERGVVSVEVVSAATRTPLSGVQVTVPGTDLGGLTNAQGRVLLLNVPAGARTVRVTVVGYATSDQQVTVTAGGTASVRFELREEAIALPSVVVTALGQQREQKSLGYAVQTVGSVALERSPELTLVNALSGQAAGVQVTRSSGQPGASSRIVIRGESSFQGGGQPLFVVDGIPISMDVDSKGGNPLETGEAGGRGMDIDPNNIEEISVLRGAAATALYGSRAAFGAIVIRTKQGRPGQRARFSFSSSAGMDVPIYGGKQLAYAQGMDGYFCNGWARDQGGWCQPGYPGTNPNPQTNNQWGPHRDSIPQIVLDSVGEVRFRDARRDFYRNGLVINNSLNVSGSLPSAAGAYNFTVSKVDQSGIMPSTKLDRLNVSTSLTVRLSNALRSRTSVMYANSENISGNEGYSSLTRTLFQLPMTRDIRQAWMPDGSPVMWGTDTPHPVWQLENGYNLSTTARWTASQALDLTLVPGVTLQNRFGLDTYVDDRRDGANERPWRTQAGQTSGSSRSEKIARRAINYDAILMVDRQSLERFGLGSFNVDGLVGANVNMNENSRIGLSGSDIHVPGSYNCVNFSNCNNSGTILPQERRLVGVYSQLTADFREWAFLTLTGRNDWSSTLPRHNNGYFYPSAQLSVVFTDALGMVDHPFLQYGKVRASIAKVGSDAPPYRLDTRYVTASGVAASNNQQQNACCSLNFPIPQQGGINAFVQSAQLGNPDLKPESTVETEFGLELRFLNGRARTEVSYYDKKSYDQIFDVPASPSTGFTTITRNAGDLRNRGWEFTANAVPIRTRSGFDWSITANWSRNKSSVIELAEGVPSIYLAGYAWPQIRIMEGYGYGVIWGYGFQRNENGERLIGDDGWPLPDDQLKVLGETQHRWTGSLNTMFRFRSVEVAGILETRQGGQMLNFDLQYVIPPGQAKITEKRGDTYVFEGVNVNTGQPNTVELERNRQFWQRYGAFDTHENMIESKTSTRLSEITFTFRVPRSLAARAGLQNLSVYASGRNLKVWTPNSNSDPDGSNYGAANAGGSSYRFFTAPQTRGWYFGLRTSF